MVRTYYFSVEGETEKRYLQWLEQTINSCLASDKVRFAVKIEKDPLARGKGLAVQEDVEIVHLADIESTERYHLEHFQNILTRMRLTEEHFPNIRYTLGYCNFTFELWIILHKVDCFQSLSCRRDYLPLLKQAFHEDYQSLAQYKRKRDFARLLGKLTLDDVRSAVVRAEEIEKKNWLTYIPDNTAGYAYFLENPSLSVGEIIEGILRDNGLE